VEARLLIRMEIRGRNAPYVLSRLASVSRRYGLTPRKAEDRVWRCVRTLQPYGLRPTFATPASVIEDDPEFFRALSRAGAELAVHGYDHVDFRRLSLAKAGRQFRRAVDVYARNGIPCEGFRCPYLSYTPELSAALPDAVFSYSSNRAIAWPLPDVDSGNPVWAQLSAFYRAAGSDSAVSVPSEVEGLLEIPLSVPDDLQLCDGLGLGREGLAGAWIDILGEVHRREELFAPLFHPESFDLLQDAVGDLLRALRALGPQVWMTQLRDVACWWRERASCRIERVEGPAGMRIDVHCSKRARVLVRDWDRARAGGAWNERWSVVHARSFSVDDGTRPFVGAVGLDPETAGFLTEQGYVVDTSARAAACTTVLRREDVAALGTRRALVEHIETSRGPLIKLARWPDGARSAFCFAGDLDALSLRDYARRLRRPFERAAV
jgi:hypothetical protein